MLAIARALKALFILAGGLGMAGGGFLIATSPTLGLTESRGEALGVTFEQQRPAWAVVEGSLPGGAATLLAGLLVLSLAMRWRVGRPPPVNGPTSPAAPIDWNLFFRELAERTKDLPEDQRRMLVETIASARDSEDPRERQAALDLADKTPEQAYEVLVGIANERRSAGDRDGAVDMLLRAAAFATLFEPRLAMRAYEDALVLKPGAHAPALQLVFVKLAEGDPAAAQRYAEDAGKAAADESERAAAKMALAQVQLRQGKPADAIVTTRDAIRRLRLLLSESPDDELLRRRLGEALQRLGDAQASAGDTGAARKSYEECYAIRLDMAQNKPESGDLQRDLIYALSGMTTVLANSGDLAAALVFAEYCEERATALSKANPNRDDVRREALICADQHAALLRQSGRLQDALNRLQPSMKGYHALAAKQPGNLQAQVDLKNSHLALSEAREQAGDLETALEDARQALKIAEGVLRQARSGEVILLIEEINARRWLGGIEMRAGDLDESLRQCDRALADARRIEPLQDALVATILQTRAVTLAQLGDVAKALEDYAGAAKLYAALYQRDPTAFFYELSKVACRIEIGELKARTGEIEDAAATFDECIIAADQLAAANPHSIDAQRNAAFVRYRMGDRLLSGGDARGAVKALSDAYARYDALAEKNARDVTDRTMAAWSAVSLSNALRQTGLLADAETFAKAAQEIAEQLTLADPINVNTQELLARAIEAFACVESSNGRLQSQLKLFQQSLKIYAELAGRRGAGLMVQRNLPYGCVNVGLTLMNLGRFQEAEEQFVRALELRRKLHEQMTGWETEVDIIDAQLMLATLYDEPGKVGQGLAEVKTALPIAEDLARRLPTIALVRSTLAAARQRQGDLLLTAKQFAASRAAYDESLAMRRALLRQDPANALLASDIADTEGGIAECWYQEGDFAAAEPACETALRSYEALERSVVSDHWTGWNLLLPKFRLAQIAGDRQAQLDVARQLRDLQRGEGRERVGLRQQWLIEIRALIPELID